MNCHPPEIIVEARHKTNKQTNKYLAFALFKSSKCGHVQRKLVTGTSLLVVFPQYFTMETTLV